MKKLGLATLLALTAAFWPAPAIAQKHPNIELGFNPERLYQFGNLDSVNLFNGNLIVQIPIGQTYSVNAFKYQLTLTYNSKVWDYEKEQGEQQEYTYAYGNWRSNAGLGWRLSFGRLIEPGDGITWQNDEILWKYEDASGSEHAFGKADRTPGTVSSNDDKALLSRDQSAIRMVKQSDGARHLEFPNGEIHRFALERGRWRLRKISDRFGNFLQFDSVWLAPNNPSDGREAEWLLTDSAGRAHRILFAPFVITSDTFDEGQHISSIILDTAADPGGKSTYTFDVQAQFVPWGCGWDPEPSTPPMPANASLPFLESISLPDGSTFDFDYYMTANATRCSQAALKSMTLPTKGKVEYDYTVVSLPEDFCRPSQFGPLNPGVSRKTVTAGPAPAVTDYIYSQAQETPYSRQDACVICGCYTPVPGAPPPPNPQPIHRWSRTSVLSPAVENKRIRSDSYFYTWNAEYINDAYNARTGSGPERPIYFAQPVTPRAPIQPTTDAAEGNATTALDGVNHFLSTRMFDNCPVAATLDCTGGRPLRSTSTAYPAFPGSHTATGLFDVTLYYPEEATLTEFHDGNAAWIRTKNSDPDGLHKYRKSTTTSNIPDSHARETQTNFRPWTLSMVGALNPNTGEPANDWLLNLYDFTRNTCFGCNAGADQTAMVESCFDASGYLTATRTRSSATARQTNDVLTRFSGTRGNVERVESYGARANDVSTSTPCPSSGMTLQYLMKNSYDKGVLVQSQACVPGQDCSTPLLISQRIDALRSGVPDASYDASDLKTDYDYDAFGRLEEVHPAGAAWSKYEYTAATASSPAKVKETVSHNGATLATTTYGFDGLGRIASVTRSLPNGKRATVETHYDALGRKATVTQPFDTDAPPQVKPSTVTTYDAFGRPLEITSPDGKKVTFEYTGDHIVRRTTPFAASTSGVANSVVTEHYDAQQRLVKVIEDSNGTSAANPIGGAVQTKYAYDVEGRLTEVKTVGAATTQVPRTFTYDLRGFLLEENHPENGRTVYDGHDARGLPQTKQINSSPALTFTYDGAERVTRIQENGVILKEFIFATANLSTGGVWPNLRKGKLETAIRRNELPAAGVIEVKETYEYRTPTGQMSRRTTLVEQVNGGTRARIQEFAHTMEYDALRMPLTLGMPACTPPGCPTANGISSVHYERSAGYLTGVTGFASLTYHPSGMVGKVEYAPNVADVYDAEHGLGRPSRISLAGVNGATSCPAPPIQAPDTICPGVAAIASVAAVSGVTYSWSISGGTISSPATGATITFQPGGSGTLTLTVVATSSCGTRSSTKSVSVSSNPAASVIHAPAAVCTASTGHAASVDTRHGITHTWSITGGTITSSATGDAITFDAGAGTSVTLHVTATATSGCSGSATSSKPVQITTAPAAALRADGYPIGQEIQIVRGANTTIPLKVTLDGTGPWLLGWNDGVTETVTTSPHYRNVTPLVTAPYQLDSVKAGSCEASAITGTVSIRVLPRPPQWITAATRPDGSVRVSWEAVPGAFGYRIERRDLITGAPTWFTEVAGVSSFIQTLPVTAGPRTYIYSVRTIDPDANGNSGDMSGPGPYDYVTGGTALWSQQIAPGASVRSQDIQELRTAIDAVRVAFGKAALFSAATPPSGVISAVDILTLIGALDDGRAGRYPSFVYRDVPSPAAGGTIYAQHLQQLREAVD